MNQPRQKKQRRRKAINVKKVAILEKTAVSKYKKWQLRICKWIGVEPKDNHSYLARIQYSGSHRIQPHINNVIINTEGIFFTVLKENNRLAVIASMGALPDRPNLYGTFYVHEKSEKEKKKVKFKKQT